MKLLFLVNGGPASAMGIRARSFEERLRDQFEIRIEYRATNKVYAILRNFAALFRMRPRLCWVFDMGFSGVLAAGLYRIFTRCRVMMDTGDAIYELASSSGRRGRFSIWLTKKLEQYAFAISDGLVVRSHPHQELLAARGIRADVIPDGVDLNQFRPAPQSALRTALGLDDALVVGMLGSLIWNHRCQSCYGAEVIHAVHLLQDLPVKGLIIGDGDGLPKLKQLCSDLGIAERVVFTGRLPYEELPKYLNTMDVCISTQTNDVVGQVRTSGKLPLYLACGRFVLATKVGEAARVLPPEMLLEYGQGFDQDYPVRLAERLKTILKNPECLQPTATWASIARRNFDYGELASRARDVVRRVLDESPDQRTHNAASARARGTAP